MIFIEENCDIVLRRSFLFEIGSFNRKFFKKIESIVAVKFSDKLNFQMVLVEIQRK